MSVHFFKKGRKTDPANYRSISLSYLRCIKDPQDLLRKLQHYGIQGPLLNWLESFLTPHFQSVVCEDQTSSQSPGTSGMP